MTDDAASAEWMQGFPPSPDQMVRFHDGSFYAWPQMQWSFNNMEQLVPTKAAWRGPGASRPLATAPRPVQDLTVTIDDGTRLGWDELAARTHTDAMLILHKGAIVHESYAGFAGRHVRHTMMSCNKSMVGTLAEWLIHQGQLDDSARVPTLVPELATSAWGDATVRDVLDMVVSMDFHEDYLDPKSDVWKFVRSTGMAPAARTGPETIADYLPSVRSDGAHGESFAYREPNIFVLGWIVRRVAGQDLASLASDVIWQHIGADHDWLYMVDRSGAETTALATLRDLARFGQLIADDGLVGDHQVLPTPVIDAIKAGGDQAVFAAGGYETMPGWSYRSQWWYRHVDGRICPTARGAHGQLLYIDAANDLVIARFGSAPKAPFALLDPMIWPWVDAITAALPD